MGKFIGLHSSILVKANDLERCWEPAISFPPSIVLCAFHERAFEAAQIKLQSCLGNNSVHLFAKDFFVSVRGRTDSSRFKKPN